MVPPEFAQSFHAHSNPVTAATGPAFPPGSFGANQAAHHLPLLSAGDRGSLTGSVPLFSPATLLTNILYHIAGENARAEKEKLSTVPDCDTMLGDDNGLLTAVTTGPGDTIAVKIEIAGVDGAMNKIIILVGSMRKAGNTDLLAASFAEGAKKNNEVELISVADYKVNPCIGCNSCFTRENNECFQNDDMHVIYEKLKEADMVVVASPVYFYGLSAQLKAIIDRLHTPMRNQFNIKKLALILVGAATLPELFDSIIMQYKLILNFFHLEDCGMVLVRAAKEKGDVTKEALKEAYALGAAIK